MYVLWSYRSRLYAGVVQDLRQRYVGSLFGVLWAILFPIMQLSIYAGLYLIIFKVRPAGLTEVGYVILVFSGLVPLLAFSEALANSTSSLVTNKSLLLNTVFPAELIPVRAVLSAQVGGIVGLVVTLVAAFSLGQASLKVALLIPVFWLLLIMFVTGLGWILSLFSLVLRDIQHALSLIIMLLFVLSPFAYTPEMVPSAMKIIIYLNPMSYFVLSFQNLICYGTLPDIAPAVGSTVLGCGFFLGGYYIFRRAKHVFFDYA